MTVRAYSRRTLAKIAMPLFETLGMWHLNTMTVGTELLCMACLTVIHAGDWRDVEAMLGWGYAALRVSRRLFRSKCELRVSAGLPAKLIEARVKVIVGLEFELLRMTG